MGDIRMEVLKYLNKNSPFGNEIDCNGFLLKLHNGDPTIGEICETLRSLLDKGLIPEPILDWKDQNDSAIVLQLESMYDSNFPAKQVFKKNPELDFRLYVTFKGKKYILEEQNLRRESFYLKYRLLIILGTITLSALLGFIGGILSNHLIETKETPKSPIEQKPAPNFLDQNTNDQRHKISPSE